jgi:hypothetical protein
VQQVGQDKRLWQVDVAPFLDIAKISVKSTTLATGRFASYQDGGFIPECPSDFCDKQADKAAKTCGTRGVSSFDCNQSNCTVNWECHP